MKLIFLVVFICMGITRSIPVPVQLPNEKDLVLVEGYKPYDFGYEFGDGFGMSQYRKETADENGIVQGSYGYVDPDGLYRSVEYKADSAGYRAVVKSNEPGLANQNSADVTFIVQPPPPNVLLKNTASQDPLAVVVETA